MRMVAVLHLTSGAPFKVDAASSLYFTLAFCPRAGYHFAIAQFFLFESAVMKCFCLCLYVGVARGLG